jgi:hypothetical protein
VRGSSSSSSRGSSSSGGGSSSSGGFDESVPSQAYNEDGTKFEASGTLKFKLCEDGRSNCNYITVGNVTNGVVNMQLPLTIENKYLFDVTEFYDNYNHCTISQEDAKISDIEFVLESNVNYIYLAIASTTGRQAYKPFYSSKTTRVTCSKVETKPNGDDIEIQMNLDIKAGWNKLYYVRNHSSEEYSTDNILTEDVRWVIANY